MLPAQIADHLDGIVSKIDSLWMLLGAGTILMLIGLSDDRWQNWLEASAACSVWNCDRLRGVARLANDGFHQRAVNRWDTQRDLDRGDD